MQLSHEPHRHKKGKRHGRRPDNEVTKPYHPQFSPQELMESSPSLVTKVVKNPELFDLDPEKTSLYPAGLAEQLIYLTKKQLLDTIVHDPSDLDSAITKVQSVEKLRKPLPPDLSSVPTGIPKVMLEPTVIQITDADIVTKQPNELTRSDMLYAKQPDELTKSDQIFEPLASFSPEPGTKVDTPILMRKNLSKKQVHEVKTDEGTIEWAELSEAEFNEYDLRHSEELLLSEFVQKAALMNTDLAVLLNHIKLNFEYQPLWAFIRKFIKDPLDMAVLKSNVEQLSVSMLKGILLVEATRHEYLDRQTGEVKRIVIYSGEEFESGGTAEVSNIFHHHEDSLTLQSDLIKAPIKSDETMIMSFEIETQVGKKIAHLLEEKKADPRVQNIMNPVLCADGFMIMPKIQNERGETITLDKTPNSAKFYENGHYSVGKFCRCLAGAVQGLAFLSENGFIAADNKPQNIIDSASGGVVIDLGGIVDLSLSQSDQLKVLKDGEGNLVPIYLNKKDLKRSITVPQTETYGNPHLLSLEILGKLPNDITHKKTIARCLEKLFCSLGFKHREEFRQTSKLPALEKIKLPALELDPSYLQYPKINQLYSFYRKLHYSHNHPYKYHNNDVNQGLDPDYISLTELAQNLTSLDQ